MKSVYIHIPFCNKICTYCDFCKLFYNKKIVSRYLKALKDEVLSNYKNEEVKTLYIGGGTPSSLSLLELKDLFEIIKIFNLNNLKEFTFEANPESLTLEKLEFLKKNNVNRLSIGVESFNKETLKYMNRGHLKEDIIKVINNAKKVGFDNINIDLIYATKNQSLKDLKDDLEEFLKLDVSHISTYSLILEPNTILTIKNEEYIEQDKDEEMFLLIKKTLEENGYIHYETSNFAKPRHESKHNLVYWNNLEYYGFGLGASWYINNVRYDNTRSINKYLEHDYIKDSNIQSLNMKIENEFILGLRKIKGISKADFYEKYKKDVLKYKVVTKLIDEGKLVFDGEYLYISEKYLFKANEILVDIIGENYE